MLYRSAKSCQAIFLHVLFWGNIFIVDFLQRHSLLYLERFNGPVGGYRVVELPSPWLHMVTHCRGCVACVWARLSYRGGANCVVVNRSILLFCGLCCIQLAPHPPLAHAPAQPCAIRASVCIGIHHDIGYSAWAYTILPMHA